MLSLLYMTVALNKTHFLPQPVRERALLISMAPLFLSFSFLRCNIFIFVSHFKPLTYVFSLAKASEDLV